MHRKNTGHQTSVPEDATGSTGSNDQVRWKPVPNPRDGVKMGPSQNDSREGSSERGKPICSVCNTVFLSEELLREHLRSFTSCNVCKVHLPPDWSLEAHYGTTDLHPKCERCGLGFRDEEEFGWHIFECWSDVTEDVQSEPGPNPKLDPYPEKDQGDTDAQEDRGPRWKGKAPAQPFSFWRRNREPVVHAVLESDSNTIAGRMSPAPPYAGHTSDVLISPIASQTGPEVGDTHEVSGARPNDAHQRQSPAISHTPTINNPVQFHRNAREGLNESLQSMLVNERSTSSDETDTLGPVGCDDGDGLFRDSKTSRHPLPVSSLPSGARIPRYAASLRPRDTPNLPPPPGINVSPYLSSTTSHTSDDDVNFCPRTRQATNNSILGRQPQSTSGVSSDTEQDARGEDISWHCRICLKNPCDKPVATMCGHLFCKSCIMLKMASSPSSYCPVCKKMFFLGLNLNNSPGS
ncbi:hypothetical protein L227DRAFT_602725 [Lentinus tigrinus ALCF2SS1-6]|uniref:RING-type domain-containing protein n=1 Tax=Lentinus tigrinus ALCF2SS1-6 TaxID=1328759 RepID=A0A5C2S0J0_9APHY|nr:hypothetical protein L227DRAFT_602725 [Lentinus tigrinus ALCF2SS1-6]